MSHFSFRELKKVQTVEQVFHIMGVGNDTDAPFDDRQVFGKQASYKNMYITEETYLTVMNALTSRKDYLKAKETGEGLLETEAAKWAVYAPISGGKEYKELTDRIGELNRAVLYVVTPGDPLYKEAGK